MPTQSFWTKYLYVTNILKKVYLILYAHAVVVVILPIKMSSSLYNIFTDIV